MKAKHYLVFAVLICLFTKCSINEDNETAIGIDRTIININTFSGTNTIETDANVMLNLHAKIHYDDFVDLMRDEYPDAEIPSLESIPDIEFPDIECCGIKNPQWIINEMKSISSIKYSLSSMIYVDLHLEVCSINLNDVNYLFFRIKLTPQNDKTIHQESTHYYTCSGDVISSDSSLYKELFNHDKLLIWKLLIKVKE